MCAMDEKSLVKTVEGMRLWLSRAVRRRDRALALEALQVSNRAAPDRAKSPESSLFSRLAPNERAFVWGKAHRALHAQIAALTLSHEFRRGLSVTPFLGIVLVRLKIVGQLLVRRVLSRVAYPSSDSGCALHALSPSR